MRVAAFWSGGYLPPSARGTVSTALVSVADYYATLCAVAGLSAAFCAEDARAAAAGLPPIDSRNVWSLVTGQDATPTRTELPIDASVLLTAASPSSGPWWKLFTSARVSGAGRTAPVFPNASSSDPEGEALACRPGGCLFDVWGDPTESQDVAAAHPDIVAAMGARLAALAEAFYSNQDSGGTSLCPAGTADCLCWAAEHLHGGALGPFHKWP